MIPLATRSAIWAHRMKGARAFGKTRSHAPGDRARYSRGGNPRCGV
jgi:hypothetical protein